MSNDEAKPKGLKLARAAAIAGAILSWLPIAAMAATGIVGSIGARRLRVDWLMPAELFPLALAGFILLFLAATKLKAMRVALAAGFGVAIAALGCAQLYAVASGIASGAKEASSGQLALLYGGLGAFDLGLLFTAIMGTRLVGRAMRTGTPRNA